MIIRVYLYSVFSPFFYLFSHHFLNSYRRLFCIPLFSHHIVLGELTSSILVELFADIVCLYVGIKQSCTGVHTRSDVHGMGSGDAWNDRRDISNNDNNNNNNNNNNENDEFIHSYYISLRSLPEPNDRTIQSIKNLRKCLLEILNFSVLSDGKISIEKCLPLPNFCFNLLSKKVQFALQDKRLTYVHEM